MDLGKTDGVIRVGGVRWEVWVDKLDKVDRVNYWKEYGFFFE